MVGIVAKMASNPKHAAAAGLPPPSAPHDFSAEIFFPILLSKFTRSAELRGVLLGTGEKYLLEFVRGAERRERGGGGRERWGGLLKDGEAHEVDEAHEADGRLLFGENRMGRALMWVRDEIRRRGNAGQGA